MAKPNGDDAVSAELKSHAVLVQQCRCRQLNSGQLLQLWQRRSAPVLRRMIEHGHPVNQTELHRTVELLVGIASGEAASFSLVHWRKSHHLPDCPCSNRASPRGTVKVLPVPLDTVSSISTKV